MQLYKENIMSYHASKYEQGVLWIEHILASNTNFKFYTTGLYSSSKFICNMQPPCNFLTYAGLSTNVEYLAE